MNSKQLTITYDTVKLLGRYDPQNKLERYYELLLQENKRVNLVSRETAGGSSTAGLIGLRKLAAQSLLPLEKVDIGEIDNYLDIGSGGGFPAIPILLTRKINQTCLLVERTQKKAAALRRILLKLDVKAEIVSQTFEETTLQPVFDLITLRLVKLTPKLFRRIQAVLKPGGSFIYYSTPNFSIATDKVKILTYYHSTDTDDSSGAFTLFCKKG